MPCELKLQGFECRYSGMDNHSNNPHPAVLKAFADKAGRVSEEVEKMARYGREWLGDDVQLQTLWSVAKVMHRLSKQLKEAKDQ